MNRLATSISLRWPKYLAPIGIFLGLMLGTNAQGQQGRFGIGLQNATMSRFIPPPRSISQELKQAQEAIDQEQYSDAILILGDLLEREIGPSDDPTTAGQDFFLEIGDQDQQRLDRSLLRTCRSMIGALPPKALEIYELRYGALAKQLLENATKTRDWDQLRKLRRKYFHTQSGYFASYLLARHELDMGHPLAASLLLDDLVDNSHAVGLLGDDIEVIHAIACRLSGRSIRRTFSAQERSITWGGNTESVSDWRKWIDERYQTPVQDSISTATDYPLMGGSVSRNGTNQGQLPLSSPRWMLETTATPLDEKELRKTADELAASGRLVPPSWTPIRVGNQLLMRTTERLRGVDYRTGKRVWQYPWFPEEEADELEPSPTMGLGSNRPVDRLGRRVWNDLPYGQITSDGKRVFLLDDLSTYQTMQVNPLLGIRNTTSADAGRNTLVALELATEGKMLWRIGQNPTIESELNDAFFLGAPIAVEGSLYAMAELAGDIVLVCLDPATGKLRWQQQLVAIEGAAIQYEPIRRISGATPSYHEGVLICPTGGGATIAVDLGDRMLRWGNSYPTKANENFRFNQSRMTQTSDRWFQRWHSTTATASGTSVVVTPAATDNLYCYDIVGGSKRFNKSRSNAFYVAGIRNDHLFMVGAKEVLSFEMQKGRLKWRTDPKVILPGQQIVGRGIFSESSFIVPTSGNELVEISLADGTVIDRQNTQYPLGNLVAIDGEIISQGPTRIAVALGAKTLGPRVERMLKENPNNLDALIQKALLLSEEGNRKEALAVLHRARQIDPDSDDVLLLSISSMLGELRDNPSPPEGLEEELDALIDTPAQRLEFLSLRIQSALRNKSVEDSTRRLIEFSSTLSETTVIGNEFGSILRDPARSCAIDSWIQARSAEIVALAEEQEKLDVVHRLRDEYLEKSRTKSSAILASTARQLRPLGTDSLLTLIANRERAEGNLFVAERTLVGPRLLSTVIDDAGKELSTYFASILGSIYNEAGFFADTIALGSAFEAGASEPGDETPPSAGDTSIQSLAATAAKQQSLLEPTVDTSETPRLTWHSQAMPGGMRRTWNRTIVYPPSHGGKSFQGWRVTNASGSVALQDPNGGTLLLPLDSFPGQRTPDRFAKTSGGLLILELPGGITAIDLFALRANPRNEALRWSRDFGAEGGVVTQRKAVTSAFGDSSSSYPINSNSANVSGEFRVGPLLGDRLLVLQAGDLMCIDTLNRDTLWRNSDAPNHGHIVVDNDQVAVVTSTRMGKSGVALFNLYDGRPLGSSAWDFGKVWATNGKYVLAYQLDPTSSSATVRLVDPFRNQVVLETEALIKQPLQQSAGQGMGRILQDRYMVLFDSTGRLMIWDLQQGTQLCSHETGALPELLSMQAMWMDGQILVLPANEYIRSNGDFVTQQGDTHFTVHKIISISTDDGEIRWTREFENPWGITINQPYGSPVVLLTRSKTIFTINSNTPKMDVALVRLSDGETIHKELEHEVPPQSSGLTTIVASHPMVNRITVKIDGERLIYDFSDPIDTVKQPDDSQDVPE